jgi:hypothetical protein
MQVVSVRSRHTRSLRESAAVRLEIAVMRCVFPAMCRENLPMRREFPAMRPIFLSMYTYINKIYSYNYRSYQKIVDLPHKTPTTSDPAAGTPAPEPEEDNPVAIGRKAGREERGTVRGGGGAEGDVPQRCAWVRREGIPVVTCRPVRAEEEGTTLKVAGR